VENCSEGHQNDGDDICERCGADLLWPLNPTTETRPVPGYLTGECADCRTVTKLHELEPLTRPLEPGDTVPDGACPECGAEVFGPNPGEEPTETRPTLAMHCDYCGSPHILADAYAQWSVDAQEWELTDTYPKGDFCPVCDGEARILEVDITNLPPHTALSFSDAKADAGLIFAKQEAAK
jgi:DNA-directed RNA polymerase subunit RPC12/RpoP